MKYILLLLLGCAPDGSLSLYPQLNYIPTLEQAGKITYSTPITSLDPYINDNNIISIDGVVGQFKVALHNNSDKLLSDVWVVVMVNDYNDISSLCPARIYREIFWGGSIFALPNPPQLPNGQKIRLKNDYEGTYVIIQADDIPAWSYVVFDSIVIGNAGLKINFEAYATLPDNQYITSEEESTSVIFN
jgi:hypothetical protein